jgi:hypothetical protein
VVVDVPGRVFADGWVVDPPKLSRYRASAMHAQ